MRFQVGCFRVALWKLLELWENFWLSISIYSAQDVFLQSVLQKKKTTKKQKTIIIISVSLANVWKIKPWSAEVNPPKMIYWVYQFHKFSFLTSQEQLCIKRTKTGTCQGVTACHAFSLLLFTDFYFIILELNNKPLIGVVSWDIFTRLLCFDS